MRASTHKYMEARTQSAPGEDIPRTARTSSLPYDVSFENALMQNVLRLSTKAEDRSSADIISNDGQSANGVRSSVPVPLSSPSRIYPSSIPGVSLTHSHGHPYGGPPSLSDTELIALATDIIAQSGIQTREQFLGALDARSHNAIQELGGRMETRRVAVEKNGRVKKEIEEVVAQREVERRMERRALEEGRRRKERKREMGGNA